jgi:hypothetical protein
MTISKQLKDVTGGVNLVKPEMSLSYIAAGTVSIIALLLIYKLGTLIFAKGSTFVQGRVPGIETMDYKAALGIV